MPSCWLQTEKEAAPVFWPNYGGKKKAASSYKRWPHVVKLLKQNPLVWTHTTHPNNQIHPLRQWPSLMAVLPPGGQCALTHYKKLLRVGLRDVIGVEDIYALYTYDFFSRSYLITAYIKYSVDKAILALTDSFTTHQQPVAHLTHWLTDNQLLLRVFKVK